MIKAGSALAGEDTARVKLEGGLVGLDGHRHGLLLKGRHKGRVGVLLDIGVRGNLQLGVVARSVGLAVLVLLGDTRHVRVVSLGTETTIGLDPLEGIVHEATVASVVTKEGRVARHKLLLREGLEVVVGDLVDTLKGTSGRERPARAALALVLHRGNSTLGLPIHRGSESGHIGRSLMDLVRDSILGSLGKSKTGLLKKLSPRQMRVLVVCHSEGRLLGIVLGDEIMIISEILKLMEEVSAGLGLHLVLLHPVEELLLVEGTVMHIGRCHGKSRKSQKLVHC